MIEIQNLNKSFGKLEVLKNISINFSKPGITAILGPNGSGKTTLMKSILGVVIPDKGNILFQKENITNTFNYRNHIGYLPQIAKFPDNLTIKELIDFISNLRNQKANPGYFIE